jgi:hypothetical protein
MTSTALPAQIPGPLNAQVIVLAGDRGPDDPLCSAAGVPAKALVPVGGRPVIERVLDTLERALPAPERPSDRIVSGPTAAALATAPALAERLRAGGWTWRAPGASPARSALCALADTDAAALRLLTTGDHALLTGPTLTTFLTRAEALRAADQADLAVGLVALQRVRARFPDARRTALRFSDMEVCTCNLFALLSPAASGVVALWQQVEQNRKRPWRMIGMLGPWMLLKFLLHRLSLAEALARLGRITGTRIAPILLDDPEAAVDVDSVADWLLTEQVIAARAAQPTAT